MSLPRLRCSMSMYGMANTRLMKDYLRRLKRGRTYKFFLAALICLLVFSGCYRSNRGVRIPRLDPKYGYKDKEPMGAYIAYHYINSLFNYGVTDVINKPFSR